jgi:hypothetical protein
MRIADCGLRNGTCWLTVNALVAIGAIALDSRAPANEPQFALETHRGHVVFLHEALARRFGITTVPEAAERTLALEKADGTLIPIVEDVRGRAFRTDERLRQPEVEVLARRHRGSPAIQVIRLYEVAKDEVAKDGKYELDYWCDVCAISMVELKPCECCQAETVLRRRKVESPP